MKAKVFLFVAAILICFSQSGVNANEPDTVALKKAAQNDVVNTITNCVGFPVTELSAHLDEESVTIYFLVDNKSIVEIAHVVGHNTALCNRIKKRLDLQEIKADSILIGSVYALPMHFKKAETL